MIRKWVTHFIKRPHTTKVTVASYRIAQNIVDTFIADKDFPFLVSFPRTGSHWLRMMMELYFEKPSLVRAFYYPDVHTYTCFHTHDEDLSVKDRNSVIYLYRNPVETIYSQMNYYKENVDDKDRIRYWAACYAQHLDKWLLTEEFTHKKTILTYEALKGNTAGEFAKVCIHFGQALDETKLNEVLDKVSKEKLKEKTIHDPQVVNLTKSYNTNREIFKNKHQAYIMAQMYTVAPTLKDILQ